MSILGAMNTAVSGLTAQSAAFSNISDNIANSQTVGYKGVDTSFADYLTSSSGRVNDPHTVVATPEYLNTVQGTIVQSNNSLALAISGQGFFDVSQPVGISSTGQTTFATQQYFTRNGNFQINNAGYLANDAGQFLNGYITGANGVLDRSKVVPIQVSQSVYQPVPTQKMAMTANLPAGLVSTVTVDADGNVTAMYDASGNQLPPMQPESQIYDAQGTSHTVQYTWTPVPTTPGGGAGTSSTTTANEWLLSAKMGGVDLGEVQVSFDAKGTLLGISPPGSTTIATNGTGTATPGAAATAGAVPAFTNALSGTVTFDTGIATATAGVTQTITLNLGDIGGTNGMTQFNAGSFSLRGLSQDGVPPGSFTSVSVQSSGNIYANYDNGQTRLIAQVPLATFAAADALQAQNGSSYTVTLGSGAASLQDAGTNGAGSLVTNSVESSNVDIASQLSKLIVAQQAYSANAKVVTTADTLLQQTLDMKR